MRRYLSIAVLLCMALPVAAANASTDVVNTADRELLMAVGQGHVERVDALIKAGANVNTVHPPWHLTPLLAASELSFDMVKLLVKHGAQVNVQDRDGMTPLMRAVALRDLQMVKLLLDAGAHIDVRDHRGHTALTHAILRSHADILKLLIARGAKTDIVTDMGTTSWSIAQRMREAALDMPERRQEHVHSHAGQASHPMRSKQDSLTQTQAVLEVLVKAGVKQMPQQPVVFDAMQYHRH